MRLDVYVSGRHAGVLAREQGDHVFAYLPDCAAGDFVSLTMPVRLESYTTRALHPIFQMNLPEGELLLRITSRLRKAGEAGLMDLLAFTGREGVGRVTAVPEGSAPELPPDTTRLAELMSAPDTRPLFRDLLDQFLDRGVSGVMPKVMSLGESATADRVTLLDSAAIYKSDDPEYPQLAFNEACCLQAARRAGVEVPDFMLSDDKRLIRVIRFDRGAGERLGFEDFCVLHALSTADKYRGSYERLVKTAAMWAAPDLKIATRRELFRRVVLCWMLRNGDAHQKNFGMLYRDAGSARLSPFYDVVTTTVYPVLRNDTPALTIEGRKSWALKRGTWRRFARMHCALSDREAEDEIDRLRDGVERTAVEISRARHTDAQHAEFATALVREWRAGIADVLEGA